MKTTGIALIIIGLVLTIITSFSFFTKEKVVDLGKLEITTEKPHSVNWSPILGVALIGIGGIALWQGTRKK
ncbi:MAG: hypothetical protein JXR22_08790 [Prolixibacteraceae bacterium]|nr:hypothetical protein [Prolixibacteraceae bacterium]